MKVVDVNNETPKDNLQERLEAILASAVDAIITIDQRGIVESANPATEKLFGYPIDELIGRNVSILMPDPFCGEHDQYLRNYLTSGEKKIIGIGREVVGRKKDGRIFPVHLAVSELRVESRRLFTGVIRDISDLKAVEAKLVQNERLAAIGQMVAGLAHESRNAFQRSHACLANLALDVRDMPQSLDLVHKVQTALDHLNALLEEVRDYSAPITIKKTSTDIESLIQEVWSQIVHAHHGEPIDFQLQRDEQFPIKLVVDRSRIGQVFWNLLENARAACGGAEGKIEVRLAASGGQLPYRIQIQDNGAGIEDLHVDQVFEPFFTTKTKGTGLGLAICRRIVDAHGGSIDVTSGDYGGACFTVCLP